MGRIVEFIRKWRKVKVSEGKKKQQLHSTISGGLQSKQHLFRSRNELSNKNSINNTSMFKSSAVSKSSIYCSQNVRKSYE
mmetsp:Transcript_2425/g.3149  ORF Transcript_2425/g.3149 Transcript_2425/m.3149 type:complete len:80 (+) Transcript_2425:1196-1435(+)